VSRPTAAGLAGLLALSCAGAPDPKAGAPEPSAAGVSATDTAPPRITALATSDGLPWTATREVQLRVVAEDDVGVDQVCVSDTARRAAACAPWGPLRDPQPLTLAARQGPRLIRAWARDAAGNTSAAAPLEVLLDSRGPEGGVVVATPAPGAVQLAWSGVRDAGTGVGAYWVMGRAGARAPRCGAAEGRLWEGTRTEVTISGVDSGPWALRICATDRAGNPSTGIVVRASGLFEADAPVAAPLVLAGGAAATPTRTVTVEATVTDASGLRRMCLSEEATSAEGCAPYVSFAAESAHTLSGGSGPKVLRAWFEDVHGNRSAAAEGAITFDAERPEDGLLELTPIAGGLEVRWAGFTDAHTAVARSHVRWAADRAPASCAEGSVGGVTSGDRLTLRGLPLGRVGVRVCAEDAAGNLSVGATARAEVRAELDPPQITALVLNDGVDFTTASRVRLQLSATDSSGVAEMCVSDGPSCGAWRAFTADSTWTVPASSGWHTAHVWLRDGLGNESASPTTAQIERGVDGDGDGVISTRDCDDADAAVRPGGVETCDGRDEDCDGQIDEADAVDAGLVYADADADGAGDPTRSQRACAPPAGWTRDARDCDDGDAALRPGAAEACDSVDNDCDGDLDEAVQCRCEALPWDGDKTHYLCPEALSWAEAAATCAADGLPLSGAHSAAEAASLADLAADTLGAPDLWVGAADLGGGSWAWADGSDWWWEGWTTSPAAGPRCLALGPDGAWTDAPCAEARPFACGEGPLRDFYVDADQDGAGDATEPLTATSAPEGAITDGRDCDDDDARARPGREETCDGVDEDCDGVIDEACAAVIVVPSAGLAVPLAGTSGACGTWAQTGLGHDPHNIANMPAAMARLSGTSGAPLSRVRRAEAALDFSCSCGSTWGLCSPGNYPATTRAWPVSTPTGGAGAARLRGYLVVEPDMLNATVGLFANDSARLRINGVEIAWTSWGSGQWKRLRWVRFEAPGLYPFEVEWQTNQSWDIDPLEVVWGQGFIPGYREFNTTCAEPGCVQPAHKSTPVPGLQIIAGSSLRSTTTGAASSCVECSTDADCGAGRCGRAGLCE